MANLSDLPHELLVTISKRLKKLEDFVCFRCVSKSLCAAAKDEYFEGLRLRQRTPYLMLPVRDDDDDDGVRELYSLVEGESIVASIKVPNLKTKKCFESLGWLLMVEADGNMSLLDPFSGTEIPVPHQNTLPGYEDVALDVYGFIERMVLSSSPSCSESFVLMAIVGGLGHLAFWSPGDKTWNRIDQREGRFVDVVYHGNGEFYAIGGRGKVWVFKVDNNQAKGGMIIHCGGVMPVYPYVDPIFMLETTEIYANGSMNLYILKTVDGGLLIITRISPKLSEDGLAYITDRFHAY